MRAGLALLLLAWPAAGPGAPLGRAMAQELRFVQPAQKHETPSRVQCLAAADLDGDGRFDLLVGRGDGVTIHRGAADGLGAAQALGGGDAASLVVTDLNGDGAADVVAAGEAGVRLHAGDGEGGLAAEATALPCGPEPQRPVVLDLDDDGHKDVVVPSRAQHVLTLLRGTGQGRFAKPKTLRTPRQPVACRAGDVDRDGRLDLVTITAEGERLVVHHGKTGLRFDDDEKRHVRLGAATARDLQLLELTGDGRLDALLIGPGGVELWAGDGTGGFARAGGVELPHPGTVFVMDLDGDGQRELIVPTQTPAGDVFVQRMDGKGGFSTVARVPAGQGTVGVVGADLDGDGAIDLVGVRNPDFMLRSAEVVVFRGIAPPAKR